MAKQVSKASLAKPGARTRSPRAGVGTRLTRSTTTSPLGELWAELKRLGQRSGETLVGAYVAAARGVLVEVERLEDLSAERRYRQRSAQAARDEAQAKRRLPVEGA